ncbi:Nitroreductase [Daldinia caldariorum]|uniref:Nitroreductase n=1 Tax=Daldinia caldariorum TaxID=326644 RepID=UPI002007FC8C|nr:Nitroreductase [Daldinia caldariorum]KAI1466278.1 Nitroreductase [Daldinia caldariorum]
MRPQIVTSAIFSFSRFSTTSATTSKTSSLALKTLAATCPQRALFTSQCPRPQLSQQANKTAATTYTPSTRFSTTTKMATQVKAESFLDHLKNRRTYYALSKELPISKERIQEIVKQSIYEVPSSFNSQSNRVVVLFGAEHDKLWDLTSEILKTIVPADAWESTAQRMSGFKAGAGTVLFFEDQEVVHKMQAQFSLYSDKFPIWAQQSDAMAQYAIWTAFTAEGLGANLQHYNPLIDAKVASEWGIPDHWQLNAQLVFGGRAGEPGPKDQVPIEERLKVFGA